MPDAWINGSFHDHDTASVSLRDTGLLHGAGVFTTMRSFGGRVFRLDRHLARVAASCEALSIPLPYDAAALEPAVDELLARNSLQDARLRLTVTRGSASTGGEGMVPGVFITAAAVDPYPAELYERGMTVVLIDDQKLNPYDIAASHKTLNYLSRLHALRSANARGAGEALWFDVHNFLQSGSITNVFIAKSGTLLTPPTAQDLADPEVAKAVPYTRSPVLPGVVRSAVLDLAEEESISTRIVPLTVNDLLEADEVFLTNSMMGIMPVCRIERKSVASDKPGPLTTKLRTAYERLTRS